MRSTLLALPFIGSALAARPFVNEPATGIEELFDSLPAGNLVPLNQIVALHDFDYAARKFLIPANYTYYRNGAGGEWSYRNNLEVFQRYRLRPRVMLDVTGVEATLPTTILGYNFSAPFFICPASRAANGNPTEVERGLVEGAAAGGILYNQAGYSDLSVEEVGEIAAKNNQTFFRQIYLTGNDTTDKTAFNRAKAAGAKAIIWTVDSAADGVRHRAARYSMGSANGGFSLQTWGEYKKYKTWTDLPIVLKGIQTVEDAQEAVANGADAIWLSNHGGRQVDGSPSSLEVALEIHQEAPEVFKQIEVYADGGVRYGSDVLKLLALGVRAVGLGRPFMYANVYGTEGVKHLIKLLKNEIINDAGNAGIADLHNISPRAINWNVNHWYS
ncbi:(S)-2-hydroxy-acid oxidase [Microdochium trichocladiopsis]|uniref:(S)-2-hydroxy-acid oxidase n=1 Tax=Microdochium trichocladiopsis TaxID=1682393 RepID=A0A9P8XUH9_9PEZI|nr:(S)-2-hydroxy-acid oxidase [Microdochium trichocladiopsis]KAH7018338.1 (S)-2-hydroxy-acid oxidase [Microdochium trichocladiopsis]